MPTNFTDKFILFSFKFFVSLFIYINEVNAGPYLAICKEGAGELNKQINQLNLNLSESLWVLQPSHCELTSKRDVFVYEYLLKNEYRNRGEVLNHIKNSSKKDYKNLLNAACNDEFLSNMIKFMDIKYSYKKNINEQLYSFKFNINDCNKNDLAFKIKGIDALQKERLKHQADAAKEAMEFYKK